MITPFSSLQREAQAVQDYLEMPITDDLPSLRTRGLELQAYISRSGAMIADANYWLNEARAEQAKIVNDELRAGVKLAAATQKALIDSNCKDQVHLSEFIERINSSAGKQGMMIMSAMSTLREEMKLTGHNS